MDRNVHPSGYLPNGVPIRCIEVCAHRDDFAARREVAKQATIALGFGVLLARVQLDNGRFMTEIVFNAPPGTAENFGRGVNAVMARELLKRLDAEEPGCWHLQYGPPGSEFYMAGYIRLYNADPEVACAAHTRLQLYRIAGMLQSMTMQAGFVTERRLAALAEEGKEVAQA